jgi:hypothetical protein
LLLSLILNGMKVKTHKPSFRLSNVQSNPAPL